MKTQDYLILLSVIIIWGINFLFMKIALNELPPMILGMFRFFFVIFPAILLLKKPNIAWKWLILYGLTISFGQFSLVFLAISWHFPTGLSALVLQIQVFLTVFLAGIFFQEMVKFNHIIGMITSGIGLFLIGIGQYQSNFSLISMLPVLGASISWACGNIIVKKIGKVAALSLVVWGSLSSFIAFTLLSLGLYGTENIISEIKQLSWKLILNILFLAYVSSLIGYTGWGYLLARYPANNVTPFILLVPVIALLMGLLFLGEKLGFWHWIGILTVMFGLIIHMFGGKLFKK